MQRLFNLMAFVGFLLSGSMTAALVISYLQMDKITEQAIERITEQISGSVEEQLDNALPIPFGKP